MAEGLGAAEPCYGSPPWEGVASGHDARRRGAPYIFQIFCGTSGGPATPHNDGWMVFVNTAGAGLEYVDSTEIVEQKYPIVVWEKMVRVDSEGAGRTRGAPGNVSIYGPRFDQMESQYFLDGAVNRPVGVRGGLRGQGCQAWVIREDGTWEPRPEVVGEVKLDPGETIVSLSCAGAGYGSPFERDPELVLRDVVDGYITPGRARAAYGVVLSGDPLRWETLVVDDAATATLRSATATGGPADDDGRRDPPRGRWWQAHCASGTPAAQPA